MSCTIIQTIKTIPTLPYEAMKDAILGKRYELTVHFVGPKRAIAINQLSRQKDYAPNVLSFPYTDTVGEIILCKDTAKREASDWDMTVDGYIGFLFIHGLLHLKGYDHSDAMTALEKKYIRQFKLV